MMRRRRFLTIAAASCACPAAADLAPARWNGRALGAEASVELRGLDPAILDDIPRLLGRVEALFSLHDPGSALARLNDIGHLSEMPPEFAALVARCTMMHTATQGRFDPSVQALWLALANRRPPDAARASVGWDRVRIAGQGITLAPGQALTFNGIAQGFATDLVTAHLRAAGAQQVLVNIGEFRGTGGPWRIGLSDPGLGQYGWRTLQSRALATSSPSQMRLSRKRWHILDPNDRNAPLWSSVTVEADDATLADAASTAFALADRDAIAAMRAHLPGVRRVTLVSPAADVIHA